MYPSQLRQEHHRLSQDHAEFNRNNYISTMDSHEDQEQEFSNVFDELYRDYQQSQQQRDDDRSEVLVDDRLIMLRDDQDISSTWRSPYYQEPMRSEQQEEVSSSSISNNIGQGSYHNNYPHQLFLQQRYLCGSVGGGLVNDRMTIMPREESPPHQMSPSWPSLLPMLHPVHHLVYFISPQPIMSDSTNTLLYCKHTEDGAVKDLDSYYNSNSEKWIRESMIGNMSSSTTSAQCYPKISQTQPYQYSFASSHPCWLSSKSTSTTCSDDGGTHDIIIPPKQITHRDTRGEMMISPAGGGASCGRTISCSHRKDNSGVDKNSISSSCLEDTCADHDGAAIEVPGANVNKTFSTHNVTKVLIEKVNISHHHQCQGAATSKKKNRTSKTSSTKEHLCFGISSANAASTSQIAVLEQESKKPSSKLTCTKVDHIKGSSKQTENASASFIDLYYSLLADDDINCVSCGLIFSNLDNDPDSMNKRYLGTPGVKLVENTTGTKQKKTKVVRSSRGNSKNSRAGFTLSNNEKEKVTKISYTARGKYSNVSVNLGTHRSSASAAAAVDIANVLYWGDQNKKPLYALSQRETETALKAAGVENIKMTAENIREKFNTDAKMLFEHFVDNALTSIGGKDDEVADILCSLDNFQESKKQVKFITQTSKRKRKSDSKLECTNPNQPELLFDGEHVVYEVDDEGVFSWRKIKQCKFDSNS